MEEAVNECDASSTNQQKPRPVPRERKPNWEKFGLEGDNLAEDSNKSVKGNTMPTGETELYKEDEDPNLSRPWWKANFFLRERVLFGAWDGVFTSCMLNIFGVIIFLRTGWMVGNAGVGFSILIILITLSVATIGALSAIGIVERCDIQSGGVYFLIRHVLGGQFAAALGVLYCFGQAVSCSLYTMGFGESISSLIGQTDNPWVARGFAAAVLLLLMSINMAGVKWVIRLQLILLFSIMISALDFLVGSFVVYDPAVGVMRYDAHLLANNTSPDYDSGQTFFTVFGVFFPTACGVLAGINMSGDLRDPRKAISHGTLAATGLSGTLYVLLVLVLGSVCQRAFLKSDYMIAEEVAAVGVLWLIGLYVSSATSCMGGLYGAPRILQSIVADNNFPRPISWLAIGRGPNKVPVVALALVVAISLLFICVGDVNFLAPIVTMPFLLTYIAVDYAYFALALTYDIKAKKKYKENQLYGSTIQSKNSIKVQSQVSVDDNNKGSTEELIPSSRSAENCSPTDSLQSRATTPVSGPPEELSDLDQLFPERQLARHFETGKPAFSHPSSHGDEEDRDEEEKGIQQMKPSWYSRLCNHWSSLAGTIATLVIMFATQWLYSLVTIATAIVLYAYFTYAIPGSNPGVADLSVLKWFKSLCKGKEEGEETRVIINQHQPALSTTLAQLNDTNKDFVTRRPYHQSQLQASQELPLYKDNPELQQPATAEQAEP